MGLAQITPEAVLRSQETSVVQASEEKARPMDKERQVKGQVNQKTRIEQDENKVSTQKKNQ